MRNLNSARVATGALVAYSAYHIWSFLYPDLPSGVLGFLFYAGLATSLIALSERWQQFMRSTEVSKGTLTLGAILLSLCISTGLQYALIGDFIDSDGRSALGLNWGIITLAFSWSIWGAALQSCQLSRSPLLSLALLLISTLPIVLNTGENLLVSYVRISDMRGGGVELNHLYLGDNSVLLLILSFATAPARLRPAIAFASSLILFALGGRSALYIFIAVIIAYSIRKQSLKSILLIIAVGAATAALLSFVDISDPAVERMLIAQGIRQDTSVVGREEFMAAGVSALPSQIVYGDATFAAKSFGTVGAFIHNILSVWQAFGLASFLLVVVGILNAARHIYRNAGSLTTAMEEAGVLIFMYAVVSLLLVKSIHFSIFWLALGFWLARVGAVSQKRVPTLAVRQR